MVDWVAKAFDDPAAVVAAFQRIAATQDDPERHR